MRPLLRMRIKAQVEDGGKWRLHRLPLIRILTPSRSGKKLPVIPRFGVWWWGAAIELSGGHEAAKGGEDHE